MADAQGMIGTRLSDRYEVTGELGRGGMGVVYRALDSVLDREVAVKLIPPAHVSPDTEERFQREAKLVAQMDHPGIVPVYDFGRHEESLFLVMPVVPGSSLRPFLKDKSLLLGDVVDVGIAVAEALEYSHSREVVHRDIKPENIMVSRDEGGGLRVRVMDFGLARVSTKTRITQTGVLVGTMAYVSPEQVTGGEIDPRTDVYALGTVLYECITGRAPFAGEMQSVLYRIVHELPQAPRTLGIDIGEDLEEAILGCLAKEPAERPQSAASVKESLRRCRARFGDTDRNKSLMLSGSGVLPRQPQAPFVGRKKEVAELQKRLNAAIAGECQFAVVGGEPGSGRTRLLDELENLARARGIRVLHGRFVEQNRSFPYQGFCEAIQEYFRQKETGSSSSAHPDFSDVAADLVALFPMLAEVGDIRGAAAHEGSLPAEAHRPENQTQVFELLARTFIRIAGGKPLVLLLEDLHGAEVSIDALQYIVPRLGPTQTLVLGTFSTTEVDRRHPLTRLLDAFQGDRRFASLTLGSFTRSEHRLFLETLMGGTNLADDLVEKLYDQTEGNAFFTKELVRSLLDSDVIGQDEAGTWSLVGQAGVRSDALPATIQQAVEKRIHRLPNDLRDILSVAAVLGKTFDFLDLEALAGGKCDLEDAVDRLVQDGLIEEERESRSDLLTFASGIVHDVLYGELSRRKRRVLHRNCAEQLEQRQKGRLDRIYPELVYHFSEGDIPDKTVEYGLLLAQRSLDAFSPEEAVRAAKTALEFLDDEWEGERAVEGEARMLLARAYSLVGDVDGALIEIDQAVDVLTHAAPARAADAMLLAAQTAWQARRPDETNRWVERGLKEARAAVETETVKPLLSLGVTLANLRGEYARANDFLKELEQLGAAGKEVEPEEEVPRGGTLAVALANPSQATEPSELKMHEDWEILTNVFETLLSTDREGNLIPSLCEQWEIRDDGNTLYLELRDDVYFQDGHRLAASDVKRSFERSIRRQPHELPPAYAAIRGVEAFANNTVDEIAGLVVRGEHELEIHLAESLPIYPAFLTDYTTGIAREASAGGVLGTGPFVLAEHGGERIVLKRSENYWKGSGAPLDAIEFRPGMKASSIAANLRSGEIDLGRDLLAEDLEEILKDPQFRDGLVEAPKKNTYFVVFNALSGPVARNPEVRRALCGMVRTHDLVWQTLGRFGQPATCLLPPGIAGHDPGRRRQVLLREEVEELLSVAKPPIQLRANVHPLIMDRYGPLLMALFSLWSDVGVHVTADTTSLDAFFHGSEHNEGIDLMIMRWAPNYGDPDGFTHTHFHTGVGLLKSYFSSEESDQLLAEARAESRATVRLGLYRKFENLLSEGGIVLPLFHEVDYRLGNRKVRGVKLRSSPPYVNYSELGKADVAAPAPEPSATGGVIHVPVASSVQTLEPCKLSLTEQSEVLPCVFEALTRHVEGARVIPWLAAQFELVNGGRTYRFRLREDVRFHDGRRLTARDVRYSYERLLRHWDYRDMLSPIRGASRFINGETSELEGFKISSATEFTIELETPISFFPVLLSHAAAGILPEGTEELGPSWQRGFVGTGPFRVVEFDAGRRLELERNPQYWRPDQPRSERLIFTFGLTPKEILSGFRDGRFSLCSDLFPADVQDLRRDTKYASGYRETPHLSTYYVAFNCTKGPLQDREVRRALQQSVPATALVREALGRLAVPSRGLIPPGLLGHDPTYARETPAPSTEGKRALEGLELTAAFHPLFFENYSALAGRIVDALQQTGVKIRCVNETLAEFIAAADDAAVDLILGRWVGDYPDTDTFLAGLHSREGGFGRMCGSDDIDRLAEQARTETEPSVRHGLYRKVEEALAREARLIPLFHEQVYRFAQPELEGLTVSYGAPVVDYAELRSREQAGFRQK